MGRSGARSLFSRARSDDAARERAVPASPSGTDGVGPTTNGTSSTAHDTAPATGPASGPATGTTHDRGNDTAHQPYADQPFVDPDPTQPGFIRIWDDDGPGQPGSVAVTASWQVKFGLAVAASDLLVVTLCSGLAAVVGFGAGSSDRGTNPWVLAAASIGLVVVGLVSSRAWDLRVLGHGAEEWSRLFRAFVNAAIVLGLAGLVLERLGVRPWVFGVLPVAGLLAMSGRYGLRRILHRARKEGRGLLSVLAIGTDEAVRDLPPGPAHRLGRHRRLHAHRLRRGRDAAGRGRSGARRPRLADPERAQRTLRCRRRGHHPGLEPEAAAPARLGPRGDRVRACGRPGPHGGRRAAAARRPRRRAAAAALTEPRLSGIPRLAKLMFDRLASAALLLVLAPIFATIALAVKLDGGPVFYRQTRVGQRGRKFDIVKFRSMVPDADRLRSELAADDHHGSGPLFKMRRDPRVTRVGTLLRRYSLDELPQLFNVLGGSMSLVGPRPPLPGEVEVYSDAAKRKFLVRPGMTGLWQVSGRSDLSWEESVRLDLRYVENWTPAMDLVILWKTVSTVFRGDGAY